MSQVWILEINSIEFDVVSYRARESRATDVSKFSCGGAARSIQSGHVENQPLAMSVFMHFERDVI
jgi:hypothetical protein